MASAPAAMHAVASIEPSDSSGMPREPGDHAGEPAAKQQREGGEAEDGGDRLVTGAQQLRHGTLARPRRVVERRDHAVAGAADEQLADSEAGDRNGERQRSRPRLPQHPGHAAAGQRHAGAEGQPARDLCHGQQRRAAAGSG